MSHARPLKIALAALLALGINACTSAYTGPVEVTRFVAAEPAGLGQGTIALSFDESLKNQAAKDAFRGAISDELALLGYTVIDNAETAGQIARIDTSRSPLASGQQRNPVSVGVGGSTGSYGSGLGVGVGFNLGGTSQSPRVLSQLSIAISANDPETPRENLWEARAQFPTSVDSPYAAVEDNARALAAAVFKDFPGGNGDTISLDVTDLVEKP
ncbi:MAG: hypothetical protein AAFR64_01155 [Pseudomonadota bacterium]